MSVFALVSIRRGFHVSVMEIMGGVFWGTHLFGLLLSAGTRERKLTTQIFGSVFCSGLGFSRPISHMFWGGRSEEAINEAGRITPFFGLRPRDTAMGDICISIAGDLFDGIFFGCLDQ